MSGELEDAGERLAGFVVGALHDGGVVGATEIQRATAIAAEEIAVSKAMGAYWCSWCSLHAATAPGVQASDEAITFVADGVALQLKRVRRIEPGGRIVLEIQARTRSFGGSYATEVGIDELLSFASELRVAENGRGGIRTATLRNANNESAIEVTLNVGDAAMGRYVFRSQTLNGLSAELSGSFVADSAMLNTLGRELISLVHDSWAERSGT